MGNIPSSISQTFNRSPNSSQGNATVSDSDADAFTKISNLKTPTGKRSLQRLSAKVDGIILSAPPQQRRSLAAHLSNKFDSMALENYSRGRNVIADQLTIASLQLSGIPIHVIDQGGST